MEKAAVVKNKSERIADCIMASISDGKWKPGTRLPSERELIELYGVSRSTIRKALASLTGQGVLYTVQGGGTYINESLPENYLENALQLVVMDKLNYREVQEFRLLIEPSIAARAATTASKKDLQKLLSCIERQEEAQRSDDFEKYIEEDNLFHNLLAESVHNGIMEKVSGLTQDLMSITMTQTAGVTRYNDGVVYHRAIYNCLIKHDSEGARSMMWVHIMRNLEAVK